MRALRSEKQHWTSARRAAIGLWLVTAVAVGWATTVPSARAGCVPTIVSLTFDDGSASEYWALAQLQQYGMAGTCYVNSVRVGTSSYYMTWSQIHDLYNAGNEIGGHTAMHVNLPQTDPVEAERQICDDRVNLINQGFQPTDFAYPFGAYNANIEQMAAACGYHPARATNTVGQTIPPQDPYAIHQGATSSNLSDYENAVQHAGSQGGAWRPLVFPQTPYPSASHWLP